MPYSAKGRSIFGFPFKGVSILFFLNNLYFNLIYLNYRSDVFRFSILFFFSPIRSNKALVQTSSSNWTSRNYFKLSVGFVLSESVHTWKYCVNTFRHCYDYSTAPQVPTKKLYKNKQWHVLGNAMIYPKVPRVCFGFPYHFTIICFRESSKRAAASIEQVLHWFATNWNYLWFFVIKYHP